MRVRIARIRARERGRRARAGIRVYEYDTCRGTRIYSQR